MDERFMYTVCPRVPIRNIVRGKVIVRSTNLSLSKDDVLECLKYGRVYRKFYCEENLEMVTPSNIDRLHRKDHLTEAEYNAMKSSDNNSEGMELEKKEVEEQSASDDNLTEEKANEQPEISNEDINLEENAETDDIEVAESEKAETDPVNEEAQKEEDPVVYSGNIVHDNEQQEQESGESVEKKEVEEQSASDDNLTEEKANEQPVAAPKTPKNNSGSKKSRNNHQRK